VPRYYPVPPILSLISCIGTVVFLNQQPKLNRVYTTTGDAEAVSIVDFVSNRPENASLPLERSSNVTMYEQPVLHLQSRFLNYYYNEPSANDSDDIFKLFEECRIDSWSKNSPEHYFMSQLQMNANGHRVFDCQSAQIVVIPISLGNWKRNRCGVPREQYGWQRQQSAHHIIGRINERVFEDEMSCWNVAPKTRPFHLLLVGGSAGRIVIRGQIRSPGWRQRHNKWTHRNSSQKRAMTSGRLWITNRLIVADSYSENALWTRYVPIVTVSHGFTSVATKQFTLNRLTRNAFKRLIVHSLNDHQLGPNKLPEVTIVSDFNEWRERKFNLFLMGQADDRKAYSLRQMALRQLPPDHNVLIQTGNIDQYRFTQCRMMNNTLDIDFFPCSMEPSERLYVDYLTRSRFNLMFYGDDPCSSRFYDALAFNTINIVISDGFHSGCIIGSELMTERQRNMLYLTVNEDEFGADPTNSIQREIDKYNDSHFERMLIEIEKWKPYLLWDSYRSQTAETLLLEAFTKAMESAHIKQWRKRLHLLQGQ